MKFVLGVLYLQFAVCVALPANLCDETFNSVEECVSSYWRAGYRYPAILMFLSAYHGIFWTLRQLKYFINHKLGLRRYIIYIIVGSGFCNGSSVLARWLVF